MAVLLETSKGDIVIDLLCEDAPVAAKNFLKLCKIKYYNDCLFHDVQKNFIVQTGDPTGTGRGGTSVFGRLYGDQARYFEDEIRETGGPTHDKVGTVGMASAGPDLNASQFYITTAAHLDSLDGKRTVFGEVTEGLDVLARINDAFCDDKGGAPGGGGSGDRSKQIPPKQDWKKKQSGSTRGQPGDRTADSGTR